jgi:hypothetical protein
MGAEVSRWRAIPRADLVRALQEHAGLLRLPEDGMGHHSFDEHLQTPPPLLHKVLGESADHRLTQTKETRGR